MIVYERPVRFEDVDAAGIVFFARFLNYCHEAMEHFWGGVPGRYVGLITKRRIGFPAVHLEADFRAPLRYGDVARIEVTVPRIGTTSCTFHYRFMRVGDAAVVAMIDHVTVATALDSMQKLALPPDCRTLLEAHPAVSA